MWVSLCTVHHGRIFSCPPDLHPLQPLGLHLPFVSPCALCVLDAFFGDCQTCTHLPHHLASTCHLCLLVHCASWTHFLVTAQLAHICLTTWLPPVIYVSLCTVRPGRIFW